MSRIVIWESPAGQIRHFVQTRLAEHNKNATLSDAGGACNLLILAQPQQHMPPTTCDALLVSSDICPETIATIHTKWAVSFGLSGKDSITVSSLDQSVAVLALQREIVTLSGTILERQEFPVIVPPGIHTSDMMAALGCLLMLDVPPKSLAATIKA